MLRPLILLIVLCGLTACQGQPVEETSSPTPVISYHVNDNAKNREEDYFVAISDLWKDYLDNPQHYVQENDFWSYKTYARPDYSYVSLLFYLIEKYRSAGTVQCTILGVQPQASGYYHLRTMFSEVDTSTLRVQPEFIVSVYAKREGERYLLVNALEYATERYRTETVAGIEYIIHPEHDFQRAEAEKMAAFNLEIATRLGQTPLNFKYVVANNTDDLARMYGVDFNPFSLQANPSGGMADTYNQVILAGNNAAYYPHELVHLYTHAAFPGQYHRWVDEGIAALFGGSTGYYIEWHWQKLKQFLAQNPEYPLDNLGELERDVPNGEYTTDFRYAIGGYLMHRVHEKEGMKGLFEALAAGRTDADYFAFLEAKLGVGAADFDEYIRREMAALAPLSEAEMSGLKY